MLNLGMAAKVMDAAHCLEAIRTELFEELLVRSLLRGRRDGLSIRHHGVRDSEIAPSVLH